MHSLLSSNDRYSAVGIIKKQAFQSSVLLYTGVIIGFITTGLMAPNLLEKSEIGTLKLLQSYSAIFMSLGVLGFSTITLRFLPHFYDKITRKYHGFLGISMLVGTVGSIVATIVILLIKPAIIENNLEKSPQFSQYFILIIPLTIFQIYYTLFDSYNNALSRSSFGVFLRDFVQRIIILLGLLLITFHVFSFDQYIYYYVAALCIPTLLMFFHLIHYGNFDLKINVKFLNKPLVNSMTSVGLFGLLNTFSAIAILQIDSIMLNMYLDADAVGIYAITFYFGTLVLIPSKALNKIAPTLIAKAYKENDMKTVRDIYYKSAGNLFLIGTLILLGLSVNLENIFNTIPKSYEEGKFVILFIGLANLLKMSGGSNDSVITFSTYYRMTTVFLTILVCLIILFNLLFIPMFGMIGAAVASMLAVFIHSLIKFIFIKVKTGFNPYNYQFLIVIAGAIMIYLLIVQLPAFESFIIEILLDSLVTAALFYIVIRFLPIASEANDFARQIVKKTIKIFKSKLK